MLNIPSHIIWR